MTRSRLPKPPANIATYVRILGVDGAVDFLLEFGGAEVYFPANPQGKSALEKSIGTEKMRALVEAAPHMKARIPNAKPWLSAALKSKGLSVAEIARKLHINDSTVRRHLDGLRDTPTPSPDQPSLF
ncbi:ArsR family transcriptional regulator [Roseobacter sp. YSTF-M11]|uniref:ArsR family transcriptional regulator n=1 Tax=Roseobacter insulae TaxID=2859783 RepID=A0A9X1JYU8_9RHOB|nr:ArsR family transcriptional regulator [Roseobacter insulae]MBW4708646.1 ArsR family transcriptional regulator [Roseobacter insulae]